METNNSRGARRVTDARDTSIAYNSEYRSTTVQFLVGHLDWGGERLLHAVVQVPQPQLSADVGRYEQRGVLRRPTFDANNWREREREMWHAVF